MFDIENKNGFEINISVKICLNISYEKYTIEVKKCFFVEPFILWQHTVTETIFLIISRRTFHFLYIPVTSDFR